MANELANYYRSLLKTFQSYGPVWEKIQSEYNIQLPEHLDDKAILQFASNLASKANKDIRNPVEVRNALIRGLQQAAESRGPFEKWYINNLISDIQNLPLPKQIPAQPAKSLQAKQPTSEIKQVPKQPIPATTHKNYPLLSELSKETTGRSVTKQRLEGTKVLPSSLSNQASKTKKNIESSFTEGLRQGIKQTWKQSVSPIAYKEYPLLSELLPETKPLPQTSRTAQLLNSALSSTTTPGQAATVAPAESTTTPIQQKFGIRDILPLLTALIKVIARSLGVS